MYRSDVFSETYQSQLGPLELFLSSSSQVPVTQAEKGVFNTSEHEVLIKKVNPLLDWLPVGMQVERANAWLFYIHKRQQGEEQLRFGIELRATDKTVKSGAATGQDLIAVEFENGIRQLHIGTEDADAMAGRALKRDHMPARFESPLLKYEMEITTITAHGLSTKIPALEPGERFYFHYIVAENPYAQSPDYPGEADASTWFAVDQPKKQLEQVWRAQS